MDYFWNLKDWIYNYIFGKEEKIITNKLKTEREIDEVTTLTILGLTLFKYAFLIKYLNSNDTYLMNYRLQLLTRIISEAVNDFCILYENENIEVTIENPKTNLGKSDVLLGFYNVYVSKYPALYSLFWKLKCNGVEVPLCNIPYISEKIRNNFSLEMKREITNRNVRNTCYIIKKYFWNVIMNMTNDVIVRTTIDQIVAINSQFVYDRNSVFETKMTKLQYTLHRSNNSKELYDEDTKLLRKRIVFKHGFILMPYSLSASPFEPKEKEFFAPIKDFTITQAQIIDEIGTKWIVKNICNCSNFKYDQYRNKSHEENPRREGLNFLLKEPFDFTKINYDRENRDLDLVSRLFIKENQSIEDIWLRKWMRARLSNPPYSIYKTFTKYPRIDITSNDFTNALINTNPYHIEQLLHAFSFSWRMYPMKLNNNFFSKRGFQTINSYLNDIFTEIECNVDPHKTTFTQNDFLGRSILNWMNEMIINNKLEMFKILGIFALWYNKNNSIVPMQIFEKDCDETEENQQIGINIVGNIYPSNNRFTINNFTVFVP